MPLLKIPQAAAIDVTLSNDPSKEEISSFLQLLWGSQFCADSFRMQIFADGLTNRIVGCFRNDNSNSSTDFPSAVCIRIFGKGTEQYLDREKELTIHALLGKAGLAAPLYGTFQNGVCYGYSCGSSTNTELVRDGHISLLIASKMSALHSCPVPSSMSSVVPFVWSKTEEFLSILKEGAPFANNPRAAEFVAAFGSFDQFNQGYLDLKQALEGLPFKGPLCICHNDLMVNNILYDADGDVVNFIDFEYSDLNYAAFDIANHFCEHLGAPQQGFDFSRFPSKEFQYQWLTRYLTDLGQISKSSSEKEVASALDQWFVAVQKYCLGAHYLWIAWALVQWIVSDIDFNYLGYAIARFNVYKTVKPEFLKLCANSS